jgi:hypothetical protein
MEHCLHLAVRMCHLAVLDTPHSWPHKQPQLRPQASLPHAAPLARIALRSPWYAV